MAYAQLEPFGESRADLRAGIVASVLANANRAKGAAPFTPSDFMPEFDKPAEPSPEQLAAQLAGALGIGKAVS